MTLIWGSRSGIVLSCRSYTKAFHPQIAFLLRRWRKRILQKSSCLNTSHPRWMRTSQHLLENLTSHKGPFSFLKPWKYLSVNQSRKSPTFMESVSLVKNRNTVPRLPTRSLVSVLTTPFNFCNIPVKNLNVISRSTNYENIASNMTHKIQTHIFASGRLQYYIPKVENVKDFASQGKKRRNWVVYSSVSQNFYSPALLVSKNSNASSHSCSLKYTVSRW